MSHLLEEMCIKYSFLNENKREEYLSCAKSRIVDRRTESATTLGFTVLSELFFQLIQLIVLQWMLERDYSSSLRQLGRRIDLLLFYGILTDQASTCSSTDSASALPNPKMYSVAFDA